METDPLKNKLIGMDDNGNFVKPAVVEPTKTQDTVLAAPGAQNYIRAEENKSFELNPNLVLQKCKEPANINPLIFDNFTDPDFVSSLPETMRSPELLAQYLENSSKFSDLTASRLPIYNGYAEIPETTHADGRIRNAEEGPILSLDLIRQNGLDPNFILYFRRTQPSSMPKPEHYWTSDYYETKTGLGVEISGQARKESVILCSTLADINSDGGLIPDINDDNGLPVRRISQEPYDQSRCLFTIKTN